MSLLAVYNSCHYWLSQTHQADFPGIFEVNKTVLAYIPSTGFVESIFLLLGASQKNASTTNMCDKMMSKAVFL
jgi:hypothetical protein